MLGNSWTPVAFRRNLLVFLIFFGLANVLLVVLYSQIFGGEFSTLQNPVANRTLSNQETNEIDKRIYKNRIFTIKDQIRTNDYIKSNAVSDKISNLAGSTNRTSTSEKSAFVWRDVVTSNSVPSKPNLADAYMTTKDASDRNLESSLKLPLTTGRQRTTTERTTHGAKPSKATTERSGLNYVLPTKITTDTFRKQFAKTRPTKGQQQNTSKLKGNASKVVSRETLASLKIPNELIDSNLNESEKLNSTKPATASNTSTPTNAATKQNLIRGNNSTTSKPTTVDTTSKSSTPFQKVSVEDAFCKPYELSAKAVEYTTKKYAIMPEIRKCQDQKSPPNILCEVNETKSNNSYTNLKIECNFSVCDRSKKMFIEYMDNKDGLMKKYEIPKNSNDSEIELLIRKFADDSRKQDLPFLFVNCTGVDATVVSQILTFLPLLPPVKDNTHRNKININIFLVDSVSRPHFCRSFPETISYLKDIEADSRYPAHVFNFELFQAVHGHTNENERALFNGSLFPIHLGSKARDKTAVNLEPLYGIFKKAGFQTMFLDDLCWRAHWGIMDKYKVGSWKSLLGKLRVSNIDTRGISESSCTILNRNKMGLPFYAGKIHQICFNARHQHEYVLDYVTKYLDAIADGPQSKPLFSYTSTHVSHDNVGIRVQTLDVHLKDFIEKMSTREETLSIIFADHGNTYTSYQASADGKQEMFHPFMLIVVPKKMGQRFGGRVLRNLHENQKRLFTLFDIRAGLVELSSYDGKSPLKPAGIFGKIAPNRSCDDLLVTEQSKCICQGWETSTVNSTDQLAYAEFAIGQINNKIQTSLLESRAKGVPHDKSRVVFGACQRLRVQNIYNVKIRRMRDGTMATTMDVRVQSSNLLKQKELITVQVLSKDKSAGSYKMSLLSQNRISAYGPYRTCMDKNADVKLCVCNNPKDPQPQTAIEDVVGKHSEVQNINRCLYAIHRTYNDSRNEPLVKVFEVANICEKEEFTVKFEANGENVIFSTAPPMTVKLTPQTAHFLATARITGNNRTSKLNTVWQIEEKKSS